MCMCSERRAAKFAGSRISGLTCVIADLILAGAASRCWRAVLTPKPAMSASCRPVSAWELGWAYSEACVVHRSTRTSGGRVRRARGAWGRWRWWGVGRQLSLSVSSRLCGVVTPRPSAERDLIASHAGAKGGKGRAGGKGGDRGKGQGQGQGAIGGGAWSWCEGVTTACCM
jgi:hypothetical protein